MKLGFYGKLAWEGIRKNRRLYLPFLLTAAAMVAVTYIMLFLQSASTLLQNASLSPMRTIFFLGSIVITLFAAIFLFYTHSFLIRCRKREFGLYHVLGMGKHHLGLILLIETVLLGLMAMAGGLAIGVLLSRLSELLLGKIIHAIPAESVIVSRPALLLTAGVFAAIFALLYLNGLLQLRRENSVSLLKAGRRGEISPKANPVIGLLGLITLGAGYAIALRVQAPLQALGMFFIAVVLVIIGTYLLFIAGSVLVCRLLQKNKRYYYQPNHFVSLSNMVFRMKRNGAGLASICIVSVMVLVTMATTTCLYFGMDHALNDRYPRELNAEIYLVNGETAPADRAALLDEAARQIEKAGGSMLNETDYTAFTLSGILQDQLLHWQRGSAEGANFNVTQVFFLSLADYNRMTGSDESLAPDEMLVYPYRMGYEQPALTVEDGPTYRVRKQLDAFPQLADAAMNIAPTLVAVVSDLQPLMDAVPSIKMGNGKTFVLHAKWVFGADTGLSAEGQQRVAEVVLEAWADRGHEVSFESRERNRMDFFGLYGGLFFFGGLVSLLFMAATVLMIYYKQVTEGYEDRDRFLILKKVGMTDDAIRHSIHSQLLTVFALPLAVAGIHLAFAFPMVRKLLVLFNMMNWQFFLLMTGLTFLVYAAIYTLVYVQTGRVYHKLVDRSTAEQAGE